jgi:phage/plasmid-associated DNA primase
MNKTEENKKIDFKIDFENKDIKKDINNITYLKQNHHHTPRSMENQSIKKILQPYGVKLKQFIPYKIVNNKKVVEKSAMAKFKTIKKKEEAKKRVKELLGEEGEILTCYNLKESNLAVIDNDDENKTADELYNEMVEKYEFLKNTYAFTGTTKGIRFIIQYDNNDIDPYYKTTHQKIMKDYDGDYCKDQWWNTLGKKSYTGKEITKITTEQLDLIFNRVQTSPNGTGLCSKEGNIITNIPDEVENISTSSSDIMEIDNDIEDSKDIQEIKEHINNINAEYFKHTDNYKLIYASFRNDNKLKNIIYNKLKPYATNEPRPFDDWFEYLYNRGKNYELLNEQTFKNYSYKSDKLKYFVISNKYYKDGFVSDCNLSKLSKGFIECNKENIIVHKKDDVRDIYIYNEKFKSWNIDLSNKEGKNYGLKGLLDEYLESYYESWVFHFKNKLDEEKNKPEPNEKEYFEEMKKEATKAFKKSQGNTLTNGVLDRVVRDLFNNYNDNDISFDERIELLPFQNGKCIDLFTFETKNIEKEDYIITKLDYNWIPPTKEEMKQFDEILNSIIDLEDVRNDLLYMFSCALFGYRVEYFFILNGGGRNGKSLLIDIFKEATKGIYYYASSATLEKAIDGGKPDPAIAGIHNKRAVMFGEGQSNVKASQSTIKALVGDSVINCRGCYSNRTEQRNIGTYIIPTNEKPTIDGQLDGESIVNKIRDIYFRNTFTNDESKLHLPNHYKQNPRLKKPEFINKMKFCFIQKCVNFIKKQKEEYNENIIYVNWKWSEQVKEDSKAYIQSCDIILQTIKEHYDITQNEKDVVSTEEIYENFITNNNDIVRNRKIYPQHFGLSYKSFKEWVKKHDEFKYQFEAKPTNMGEIKENGFCLVKRNVIKCLKAKEQEQEQNECLLSD